MRTHAVRVAIAALALLGASLACAQSVAVRLSPGEQDVKRGARPGFEIELRAQERSRIVDVASRVDLRDRLIKPRVSGRADVDDIPVSMSELRPYGEGDYITLEKGNSVSFASDGAPLALDRLAPGRYTLVLRYKPDWSSAAVQSNAVSFRVLD